LTLNVERVFDSKKRREKELSWKELESIWKERDSNIQNIIYRRRALIHPHAEKGGK